MNELEILRKEVTRLQRLNGEWCELFSRIDKYCSENVNVKLGHSKVDTLINEHRVMKEKLK